MVPRRTKRWREGDLEGNVPAPANAYPRKERNFHPFGFRGQPSPHPSPTSQTWSPYCKHPFPFSIQYSRTNQTPRIPLPWQTQPSLTGQGLLKPPFCWKLCPLRDTSTRGDTGHEHPFLLEILFPLEIAVLLPGAALIRRRCGGGESLGAPRFPNTGCRTDSSSSGPALPCRGHGEGFLGNLRSPYQPS